jgi:hypothetical protein
MDSRFSTEMRFTDSAGVEEKHPSQPRKTEFAATPRNGTSYKQWTTNGTVVLCLFIDDRMYVLTDAGQMGGLIVSTVFRDRIGRKR